MAKMDFVIEFAIWKVDVIEFQSMRLDTNGDNRQVIQES